MIDIRNNEKDVINSLTNYEGFNKMFTCNNLYKKEHAQDSKNLHKYNFI